MANYVSSPEQQWGMTTALTPSQRHQLVVEWNDTERALSEKCLHERVEHQVQLTPEAIAVVLNDSSWTYQELDRRANSLAGYLQALGISFEDRIGLCIERSLEVLVGMLGALKVGASYVPIDPEYPRDRQAYLLEDSDVSLILTQEHLAQSIFSGGKPVIRLDIDWPEIESRSVKNIDSRATFDSIAYVIYTSGSTGLPKGVMVYHRGVVNRLLWSNRVYPFVAADKLLQKASLSFDVSVWECFGPLLAGGQVVFACPGRHRDPTYLAKLIAEREITHTYFIPSILRMFLEVESFDSCKSLGVVIAGGEELSPKLASQVSTVLRHQYGPTEISITATHWLYQADIVSTLGFVPLGRPLFNLATYVLDDRLELSAVGVAGELFIGGVGVARGYLGAPAVTAEKFLPDPFSGIPGARLYRTGDRALLLRDGMLRFLGRADHQVKIRGFRIELGEIEAALRSHPHLREAVVVAREKSEGDRRLIAYVVTDSEVPLSEELRDHLRGKLPDYMVPSSFVQLAALPLNPTGKLDRRALPEPDGVQPGDPASLSAARTPTEEIILGIWAEVLEYGSIGLGSDFFDLGGNSLLVGRVMARLREVWARDISFNLLFEHSTPERLAAAIDASQSQPTRSLPPLESVSRSDGEVPASYAQERLWLSDQLNPGSNAFNIGHALRLRGALSVAALDASLSEVLRRHEVLRTRILTRGTPFQLVEPTPQHPLAVAVLSALPEALREIAAQRAVLVFESRSFDIARGPMLRAALLELAEDDHILCFAIHHIAFDGWSLGLFIREITALYRAFSSSSPVGLPALPIQYADFAVWQRRWLQGDVLEEQLGYWSRQLGGTHPLAVLPTDHPATYAGGPHRQVRRTFPQELLTSLLRLGQEGGATLFMVLLAVVNVLIYRYTGSERIVIGSMHANRTHSAVEHLIGFFVNVLPLQTTLVPSWSFRELLGRVRESALGAYAYHDVPYEKILERVRPDRSVVRNPLFQVMAILQNMPLPPLQLPDVEVSPFDSSEHSKATAIDLTFTFVVEAKELLVWVEYDAGLFERATAERLLDHFAGVLCDVTANPASRIADLPRFDKSRTAEGWLWLTNPQSPEGGAGIVSGKEELQGTQEKSGALKRLVDARRSQLSEKQMVLLRQRLKK